MHSAVLAVAVGILVIVAYEDVRTRRIPNALSLATATLGLARIALAADVIDVGYTLAAAIIIFTITFALFQRGAIGGGDAKILPATVLLVGYKECGAAP
jgi:prepilin peptidase CpaA